MGNVPTPRLGLTLDDGNEFINPGNPDFTRIDSTYPAILVNDGVTPADSALYDGAIVAERTSGKVWMAVKNVSGTFDKQWIRYPWLFTGYGSFSVPNGAWNKYGFNFGGGDAGALGPINSTVADLVAAQAVLPIKGIYNIHINVIWDINSAGNRVAGICFNSSGASPGVNTLSSTNAVNGQNTTNILHTTQAFPAGTTIQAWLYQGSGVALGATTACFISLINPVV